MDLRFSFEMDGEKSLAVKKWFINGIRAVGDQSIRSS